MEYIELYCFSPDGCREHAKQTPSTAEETFGFTYVISQDGSAGNAFTLTPVSALAHPGGIIPDEYLTWEQVRDAKACYLSHVIKAKWNKAHVDALVSFFINLESHPYNNTSEGKQALVWYQAHAREDWRRKLGTAESFNLAILNSTLLANFKKKANGLAAQNKVSCPTSQPVHLANDPAHLCTALLLRLYAPRVTPIPTSEQHLTSMHHTLYHHGSHTTPPNMHNVSHFVPHSPSPTPTIPSRIRNPPTMRHAHYT